MKNNESVFTNLKANHSLFMHWDSCAGMYDFPTRRRTRIPKTDSPKMNCSPKTNATPKTNSEDEFPKDEILPEDEVPPKDEFRRRIPPRRQIAPRRRIPSRGRIAKANVPENEMRPEGEPPVAYFVLRVYTMLSCMLTCTHNSLCFMRHSAWLKITASPRVKRLQPPLP